MRLLLLEDDVGVARALVRVLQRRWPSYEIVHVSTMAEAVMQIETGGYDVVLTDRGLPDSPGDDTVETLRALGAEVIPMSGGVYDDDTIGKGPEAVMDAIEKWGARMAKDSPTEERRRQDEARRIVQESDVLTDIRDALVYLRTADERQMERVERWQARRTACVEGLSRAVTHFVTGTWEGRLAMLVLAVGLTTWLAGPAVLTPILDRALGPVATGPDTVTRPAPPNPAPSNANDEGTPAP